VSAAALEMSLSEIPRLPCLAEECFASFALPAFAAGSRRPSPRKLSAMSKDFASVDRIAEHGDETGDCISEDADRVGDAAKAGNERGSLMTSANSTILPESVAVAPVCSFILPIVSAIAFCKTVIASPTVKAIPPNSELIAPAWLSMAAITRSAVSSPCSPSFFNDPIGTPRPSARAFAARPPASRTAFSSAPCKRPEASAWESCKIVD